MVKAFGQLSPEIHEKFAEIENILGLGPGEIAAAGTDQQVIALLDKIIEGLKLPRGAMPDDTNDGKAAVMSAADAATPRGRTISRALSEWAADKSAQRMNSQATWINGALRDAGLDSLTEREIRTLALTR